jgi:hypothetical protein
LGVILTRAILIICLIVMALTAFKVILPREQSQNTLTLADTQAKPTVLPYHNVVIDKLAVSKEGSLSTATLTLKNNNTFDVKDIEIRCDHSAKSGTVIEHNTRMIHDIVKARGSKTISDFNMGFIHSQAAAPKCAVTDARSSLLRPIVAPRW